MHFRTQIIWSVIVMMLVACNEPQPTTEPSERYPNPTEDTEYLPAELSILNTMSNKFEDSVFWAEDEEGQSYFYINCLYPIGQEGNFAPHQDKIYCWLEVCGENSNQRLALSQTANQWEKEYVVCGSNKYEAVIIGEKFYHSVSLRCDGERGNYEFRLRFYIPESDTYLTTPVMKLTTQFNTPVIMGEWDGEEAILNLDVIYITEKV